MSTTTPVLSWQPHWSQWLHQLYQWAPKLLLAIVLFFFWRVVAHLLGRLVRRLDSHCQHKKALLVITSRYLEYGVMLAGFITILATLGVNVTALVTSLGLAGLTIGFALKDALSNICSGFMLLFYRPFSIGQSIHIQHGSQSYIGTVQDINLRYTILQKDDSHTVMVPNNIVLNNTVTLAKCDTPPTS